MRRDEHFKVQRVVNGQVKSVKTTADKVVATDIILAGDLRRLNLYDKVRGARRRAIRTEYATMDVSKMVLVDRTISYKGQTARRSTWVDPDNVRPDDTILAGAENVKPFRYAKKKAPKKPVPYKPPHGPHVGSSLHQRVASFFQRISNMSGRI